MHLLYGGEQANFNTFSILQLMEWAVEERQKMRLEWIDMNSNATKMQAINCIEQIIVVHSGKESMFARVWRPLRQVVPCDLPYHYQWLYWITARKQKCDNQVSRSLRKISNYNREPKAQLYSQSYTSQTRLLLHCWHSLSLHPSARCSTNNNITTILVHRNGRLNLVLTVTSPCQWSHDWVELVQLIDDQRLLRIVNVSTNTTSDKPIHDRESCYLSKIFHVVCTCIVGDNVSVRGDCCFPAIIVSYRFLS